MNKSLYRIVFNKSRGQLMAVAETAGAQGKAASGQTQGGNSSSDTGALKLAFRTLSLCIAVTFGVFVAAPLHVQAQVAADASAPRAQQPVILQTASGITLVNIATPSAAGVSRNTFSQFDVGRAGVILNNSRANVLTQLGGYAPGNSMLAAGSARVILNEINSANPSYINGYVEVAGQRAEVIIANPSGININGGGFINASRATLTTGTPIMNGGSLDGYLVQRGNINISGAGLDASTTDYTGILARAVQVNAGIWTKELKVVAGSNQINEAQTTVTTISPSSAGAGPAPSFAIDVAQLGGMYAGKITLIGTESGLGVRSAGVIGATAGDVVVQSNGWLSNAGTVYAQGNTSLTAQGNITNTATGLIAAQGNTSLAANGVGAQVITSAGSVLAAGLNADGSLRTSGDLSITSTAAAQLKGQFAAGGGIALTSASLDLSDITLAAQNAALNATTGDLDLSRSTVNVSGTLSANAAQTLRTDGAVVSANQLSLSANRISNVAGQIRQLGTGIATLNAVEAIDNTRGTIASNGALTLAATAPTGRITNDSGTLQAVQDVSITANGISNTVAAGATAGGNIKGRNVTLTAGSGGLNNAQGTISATQNATLQDSATAPTTKTLAITNTGGSIIAGQLASIDAASLGGGGKVQSLGDVAIALTSDFDNQSEVVANNNLTFSTTGNVTNSGKLQAGNALTLSAQNITNAATGEITGTTTNVTATNTLTNRGLIDGTTTRINAPTLSNIGTGRIYGDDLSVAATTLNNDAETVNGVTTAATLAARTRLDIGATNISNREHSLIFSAGDMALGSSLDANRRATGQATSLNNASATIEALGNLDINVAQVRNTNEHFTYSTPLVSTERFREDPSPRYYYIYDRNIYSPIATSSDPAKILAGGNIKLNANSTYNYASHIAAGAALNVTGAAITNADVLATQYVYDTGTTYTLVYYPQTGSCGVIKWNCRPARDEWVTGPYSNSSQSTVAVSQITPATVSGKQIGGATTASASAAPGTLTTLANSGATTRLNNSSLFRQPASPTSTYLIETDPRFTNLRQWLSSDYMLAALGSDPASITKRLGDGFYEQRLINEQVGQLTGRRYLANFTSAEQQYQSLMNSGITVARAFNLQPGIALSAAQVAQLTSDIVWLVEQTVTLPDGNGGTTTTRALVPQLYIAKLQPGNLSGAGALLSGREVNINLTGNVVNSGTIAGRTVLNLAANNLQNIGGILNADSTSITAANDINNTGGRISAQNALSLAAGRDINITSTSQSSATQIGASSFSRTSIDRIAGLYVSNPGGTLVASAGRDVNITAGVVSNTGPAGQTTINAAGNINLATLTTADSANSVRDARNFARFSQSQEVGSQITTEGNLSLNARANINARAANIQSQQSTQLNAAGNVNLTEGLSTRSLDEAQFASTKGFMSSRSFTSRVTEGSTQSIGTNVGGNTVNVTANQDINIKGSSVIADTNATLSAGRNINIEAATNTASNTSFTETKESGFLSGGGFGISYGSREQSTDQRSKSTTAAASTVGAIKGNININAGQTFRQVGSDIVAPAGDINITAKKVDIVEARETSQTTTEQKFKQTALTLSVSSPVISAVQSAQGMAQAASQTSSGHMQALAAASTALNIYNNAGNITKSAQALAGGDLKNAGSLNVSIGTSKSQSNSSSTSDTARGSSIAAGNNVNITATGADKSAGQQSDVTIQGSSVKAGNNTTLAADNQVNLLAARNESSQTSTNSNSSSSIGASFSAQGISANASISRGSGKSDGQDTSFTNTNISAGNTATIKSGGDTNVIGAVVEANRIKADIGGSLKVESLQDTSTFTSSQKSANASISVPITGGSLGGSVGASKSNVDSNFASVGQQSGLKAGDGGFQVDVAKNTALVGAVIASNQAALDNARNSFRTGGSLSITDIQNTASFKGSASGVSVGVGSELSKSGAGVGSLSGNASSVSSAGISGIAGNTAVRSGDAETGLKPIFDADKVQKDIDAQVKITTAFTQQAGKAVGDYAGKQMKEATAKKEQAKDEKDPVKQAALLKEAADIEGTWGEGKPGRVGLHAIIGALTGNLAGALGAGASQAAIPYIADAIAQLDVPLEVKQALIQVAGGAVGAAVGGASGAASALTITANNYLKHEEALKLAALKDKKLLGRCDSACSKEIADLQARDEKRNSELVGCAATASAACDTVRQEVRSAAAEYVRKNNFTPDFTYKSEAGETIRLAQDTLTGVNASAALSYLTTLKDGIVAMAGAAKTGFDAFVMQSPAAQQQVKNGAGAAWDFIKEPSNWPQLMGAMSPADREKLAQAYEAGNGVAVGKLMGAQFANLPVGGGGMGTIKKIDTLMDAATTAKIAAQTNLLARIAQDGHALERHGGGVSDQQLLTRALTGVAPDGSLVVRNGQTVIPPSSTAFHSDALLAQSDQFIRQTYLDRAIALSPPGAQRVSVEGVDMGVNIGRGFDRVSSAPGAVGPLQFHGNLSRATAVYSYDAAAGVWRTVTIYPVK